MQLVTEPKTEEKKKKADYVSKPVDRGLGSTAAAIGWREWEGKKKEKENETKKEKERAREGKREEHTHTFMDIR